MLFYKSGTLKIVMFKYLLFLSNNKKQKTLVASNDNHSDAATDIWEDITMLCPNQCVCQRSPFMDLSVARWIQSLRRENADNENDKKNSPYDDIIFNEVIF